MRRGEVRWAEHPEDGMPRACALSADHTDTIAKGILGTLITVLGPGKVDEVCRALAVATSCS